MSVNQISGNNEQVRAAQVAQAARSTRAYAATSTSAPVRQPDAVSVSAEARALHAARSAVNDAPDVRLDRVAALKAAVADGTYKVDSRQVAQAMARKGVSL
jgi:negative regulator of flagellin synthesis FlgM